MTSHPHTPRLAALALALLPCAGCLEFPAPAFRAAASEHFVRIDAERDVIEVLSLHLGLAPGGDDALEQLRAVVDGRRVFPPGGGFLTLDLDRELTADEDDGMEEATRELQELSPSLSIAGAGLALDDRERVTLWRHVRIERASEWLRLAETAERRGPGPHFPAGRLPAFDARSSELQEAAWARGERFLGLEGDSLVIDLPSTSENAALLLAHVLEDALEEGRDGWAALAVSMRSLESRDERVRIRLGPDESGWMHLGWGGDVPRANDDGRFEAAALRAAGFEVEPWAALQARLPRAQR